MKTFCGALIFVWTAAVVTHVAADVLQSNRGTVCLLHDTTDASRSANDLLFAATANYDRARRLGLGMRVVPVGGNSSQSTSGNCDVYVGPGSDAYTRWFNPTSTRMQVEFSAASSDLKFPAQYPNLLLTNPSSEQLGNMLTDVVKYYLVNEFSIVAMPDAVSSAIASGAAAQAAQNGMRAHMLTLPAAVDTDNIARAVLMLVAGVASLNTRYVVLAASRMSPHFHFILEELNAAGLFSNFVVVGAGDMCSSTGSYSAELVSAMMGTVCVRPFVDQAIATAAVAPALDANSAARRAYASEMRDLGFPTVVPTQETTSYAYAVDATAVALKLLDAAIVSRRSLSNAAGMKLLNVSVGADQALTGAASWQSPSENNERDTLRFSVMNGRDTPAFVEIGYIGPTTPITLPEAAVFSDGTHAVPSQTMHSDEKRLPPAAVAMGVLLPSLAIITVIGISFHKAERVRDNSAAPKDSDKPVTIIFTDVEKSTVLWEHIPEEMGAVIDLHHEVMRQLVKKHKGYEVKTVGDSFMVAFDNPNTAAAFGVGVQHEMLKQHWPKVVDETYREVLGVEPQGLFGLRVRVAIHCGLCDIKEEGTGYDYYGTTVNTAARLEGQAKGGMVLISEDVMKVLGSTHQWKVEELGPRALKGLTDPVMTYQLRPMGMETRTFSPDKAFGEGESYEQSEPESPTLTEDDDRMTLRSGGSRASYATSRASSVAAETESFEIVERLLSLSKGDKDVLKAIKKINRAWRVNGSTPEQGLAMAFSRAARAVKAKHKPQRHGRFSAHASFRQAPPRRGSSAAQLTLELSNQAPVPQPTVHEETASPS